MKKTKTPAPLDDTIRAVDGAIKLGQRWCQECQAAGKTGLAKYYLKQVLALQMQKLKLKNLAKPR